MLKHWGAAFAILSVCQLSTASDLLKANEQQAAKNNQAAAASQQKIDRLYDGKRDDLMEFRIINSEIEQLKVYNRQMQEIVGNQNKEIQSLQRQIDEVEQTQQGIMPLMERMLDGLDQFVHLDTPFLLNEREERIDILRSLLVGADTTVSEKFRRVLEAYQIELEYGRTIEAYRAELNPGEMVDFLRIGRVAFYYVSLDGSQAYLWDKTNKQWLVLDSGYVRTLKKGISIARQQAAPSLLKLPVPGLEARS